MKKVYLDYAATTPVDKKVLKAMQPYFSKTFGNASSLHSFGQRARNAVEKARWQAAGFLHCSMEEIIFTGSATESDNLAILGVVKNFKQKNPNQKPHIITTAIEHPAVLEACRRLAKEGVEVTYLAVNQQGLIGLGALQEAIRPNTALISVMYVNNEIGVAQPIAEIGQLLRKYRAQNPTSSILFHTDAVQAVNYLDCDVQKIGVDLLTLSGHKIYGPKGVGILFVKKGVTLEPLFFGGGQERKLRPGTENVAGIVGLGAAVAAIKKRAPKQRIKINNNLEALRNKLVTGILKSIPFCYLNGSKEQRLPNIANISFERVEGESILFALDQAGIAVSTGSACASGSLEPSHVLTAMDLPVERAHSSIRFSLGKYTSKEEISYVLKVLPKIIAKLRRLSPIK
jgi:cysteine desulfurase